MSETDIEREIRELLSGSAKRHTKTENQWGNIGLLAGVIVGAYLTGVVNQYVGLGGFGKTILFVIFAIAVFAGVFRIGEKANAKCAAKLAEDFCKKFPKDTPEFTKAVALLRNAKTGSGVEKALLSALKMDVVFTGSSGSSGYFSKSIKVGGGKSISKTQEYLDQVVEEAKAGSFSKTTSGPGWSKVTTSTSWSFKKLPKEAYKKFLDGGKINPIGPQGGSKGMGVLPTGTIVYYGDIETPVLMNASAELSDDSTTGPMHQKDMSNELLGGFKAAAPKPEKSPENIAVESETNSGFIPLDPYDDKEAI